MRAKLGYSDLEGRFLYATPALATYVGMTPEELVGRTWYEIGVPPEAVESLEAARQRVLETGVPANLKARFVIGGSLRASDFLIKPVVAADGSIVGAVVSAWDGRDAAQTYRGRTRIDRANEILSSVDQVIVRTRDANVILAETCRITAGIGGFELAWVGLVDPETLDIRLVAQAGRDEGLLPEQHISVRDEPSGHGVVGTSFRENRTVIVQDIAHDPRMEAWRAFFERTGYQTAAGFPIRVAGRPVGALAMYSSTRSHFDAAEARLFEQVVDDVSAALTWIELEREKAEAQQRIAASERRYRDVFNMSPHPMAVYDSDTLALIAVNDAAVASYGYAREEMLGMTLADIVAADDLPKLREEVAGVLPGGGYRPSGPWRLVRRDGSVLYAEVSSHELELDGRKARLVQAIDVTERRRFEAQLAEATRMEAMGILAGGIAHDFNNLLTAVNGYADLLAAELAGDERAELALEIRRAGARAAELTKQVLAFARRQPLEPRPVDMNTVVATVAQMLRRLIGEQIRLVTKRSPRPAVVRADPGQLEQVLVNLAVNSKDAMPEGGTLEIEVRVVEDAAAYRHGSAGAAVLLTVADTGVGMDEETLVRAFEPFFTTKAAGHGTGLGLATVYGIVNQSNGQIWAESAVGHGTRFHAIFPLVEASPEPVGMPDRAAREPGGSATVLVVEDDAAVRSLAVSALEHAGYRVLVASTPAEARALSDGLADPIDLLLSDLVLPGESGRDLADRLVAARPYLRIVYMSGYDASSRDDGLRRARFLPKPFGADALLEAVRGALAREESQVG